MPIVVRNQKSEYRNQKLFRISYFVFRIFLHCFVFLISCFEFDSLALANIDPKSATPSATATVPSFAVASDTEAPTIPILVSPTDGTTTNGTKPEFVWYQSSDPNGNTVTYTLHLNGVATYLGISNLGNSSAANYTARLDYDQIKLNALYSLPDGTYDWYVTATDLAGNSSRSANWRLTIDTVAPPLTLTLLDTIHSPVIEEGANFDLFGPKDVYFTVLSDPQIQIQLNLQGPSTHTLVLRSDNGGYATFSPTLMLGTYTATIFATDGAGNMTFLPDFTLTLTQALLPIPGVSPLPIPPILYNFPSALTHLPSTVSQISTTPSLALFYALLLAVVLMILLIILRSRRYNLIILDTQLSPIKQATIYHSHGSKFGFFTLQSKDHGRLFISHLSRHSSLTIRVINDDICTTHVLSISRTTPHYTITL